MMETTITAGSTASTASSTSTATSRGRLLSIAARRRKKSSSHSTEDSRGHGHDVDEHIDSRHDSHGSHDSYNGRGLDIAMFLPTRGDATAGGPSAKAPDSDLLPRPPISSHPSQIGYLTTSSPLVQAEHNLQTVRTPTQPDFDSSFSRTASLPPRSSDSSLRSTPSITASKTGLALAPPPTKIRRSPSPAGRFRDVFRAKKSAASGTANSSPERPPTDPSHAAESSIGAPSLTAPPPAAVADSSVGHDGSQNHAAEPSHAATSTTSTTNTTSTTIKPTDRLRRLSKPQRIEIASSVRPATPPSSEPVAPVIVNTPPTPTDANHPVALFGTRSHSSADTTSAAAPPPDAHASSSMISQKRARAGSLGPSKLSSFTLAPLTPTPEHGQQPGPPTPSNGFFSSMLSAAQNATSSLSNAVTSTNLNITAPWNNTARKPSSGRDHDDSAHGDDTDEQGPESSRGINSVEVESPLDPSSAAPPSSTDSKEPAVKTLGKGSLSLSQLGIVDQPEKEEPKVAVAPPPAAHLPRMSDISFESRRRSESAPADPSLVHAVTNFADHGDDAAAAATGRSASMSETTNHDDHTPPPTSINGDKEKAAMDAIQRSGSVRSAFGRRRNRGSSAATGGTATTIAAAIAAASASVANPTLVLSERKLTGFAVASKRRNRDFHTLFKSVPDDDYLIEDYSCALQREILAHGRLYVSEGYICFSSNILGWVTTLVMSFDEVVSVEKRSTALVFKNGLMISTLHAKHIFASFASRDSTYDLIVKIWKLGHPSLQSSINGVHIDETGGDKTEKIEDGDDASTGSRSLSGSDDESEEDSDEVYDEDAEDEDMHDAAYASDGGGIAGDAGAEKAVSRKPSGTAATNGAAADKPKDAPSPTAGGEFPGPVTHAPTDCGDGATHYERILADEVIPAPLGKVFSYVFGAMSTTWMIKWLADDQKCFDIQAADKKGLGPDNRSRTISYTKPLNSSIGPRQTKCIVTESIENIDLEKAVNVLCVTQTPDVPSGNVFTVKTKYCFSWGENNGTRVQMNCTIEWTGKSWLKTPIEKGANEGQMQYSKDLFASLREAMSSRVRVAAPGGGAARPRKKGRKGRSAPTSGPVHTESTAKKPSTTSSWGLLEPVHGLLGPAVDVVKPLLTGNVVYGLLVGLLVATWFGFGFPSGRQPQLGYAQDIGYRAAYPERAAAYDEIWQREESELWDWLEERVGLGRLMDGGPDASASRKRVLEPRVVEEKLRSERLDGHDIREAIKVTEEKLKVLREVVERQEGSSA